MQLFLTNFAAPEAEAGGTDLLGALGIDLRILILQGLAFLILVLVLRKFIYPVFIKAIDQREAAMKAGIKASEDAKAAAEVAEAKIAKDIKAARAQSDDILSATQKEAAALLADAEAKAGRKADAIVADAQVNLQNQIQTARADLKQETRNLIAAATGQILDEKVDAAKDAVLIDKALKNAGSTVK